MTLLMVGAFARYNTTTTITTTIRSFSKRFSNRYYHHPLVSIQSSSSVSSRFAKGNNHVSSPRVSCVHPSFGANYTRLSRNTSSSTVCRTHSDESIRPILESAIRLYLHRVYGDISEDPYHTSSDPPPPSLSKQNDILERDNTKMSPILTVSQPLDGFSMDHNSTNNEESSIVMDDSREKEWWIAKQKWIQMKLIANLNGYTTKVEHEHTTSYNPVALAEGVVAQPSTTIHSDYTVLVRPHKPNTNTNTNRRLYPDFIEEDYSFVRSLEDNVEQSIHRMETNMKIRIDTIQSNIIHVVYHIPIQTSKRIIQGTKQMMEDVEYWIEEEGFTHVYNQDDVADDDGVNMWLGNHVHYYEESSNVFHPNTIKSNTTNSKMEEEEHDTPSMHTPTPTPTTIQEEEHLEDLLILSNPKKPPPKSQRRENQTPPIIQPTHLLIHNIPSHLHLLAYPHPQSLTLPRQSTTTTNHSNTTQPILLSPTAPYHLRHTRASSFIYTSLILFGAIPVSYRSIKFINEYGDTIPLIPELTIGSLLLSVGYSIYASRKGARERQGLVLLGANHARVVAHGEVGVKAVLVEGVVEKVVDGVWSVYMDRLLNQQQTNTTHKNEDDSSSTNINEEEEDGRIGGLDPIKVAVNLGLLIPCATTTSSGEDDYEVLKLEHVHSQLIKNMKGVI